MNLRTALARIFGMAAIVAVLAFASTASEAHGGHVHTGSSPVVLALQLPAPAVSLDQLAVHVESALQDHDGAELRSLPVTVPQTHSTTCLLSCCTGAPCHSSTACTLGPDLSLAPPQMTGIGVRVWNAFGIAACDPEGIRKPPKSFV